MGKGQGLTCRPHRTALAKVRFPLPHPPIVAVEPIPSPSPRRPPPIPWPAMAFLVRRRPRTSGERRAKATHPFASPSKKGRRQPSRRSPSHHHCCLPLRRKETGSPRWGHRWRPPHSSCLYRSVHKKRKTPKDRQQPHHRPFLLLLRPHKTTSSNGCVVLLFRPPKAAYRRQEARRPPPPPPLSSPLRSVSVNRLPTRTSRNRSTPLSCPPQRTVVWGGFPLRPWRRVWPARKSPSPTQPQ